MSKSLNVIESVVKQKLGEAGQLLLQKGVNSLDLVKAETHLKNAKDLLYRMEDELTNLRGDPTLRALVKQRIASYTVELYKYE